MKPQTFMPLHACGSDAVLKKNWNQNYIYLLNIKILLMFVKDSQESQYQRNSIKLIMLVVYF